ncbi:hypothetical protein [Neorhizobium alkalisoli]|uniref:Uncharacterized protein n=1 Tax=Neorhizobium alkalisoli TaxID=528178 RepID=A0A561PSV0_9HYPH|nr:hypothetical protein [Neorhizobium alkalisoli]TWF41176.1 hypothetical protein FHW37_1281 [Neorhizobium alkalisoli]
MTETHRGNPQQGNQLSALKSRDASDYRVSILETVGSGATNADLLTLEALWMNKLLSRKLGLNRN